MPAETTTPTLIHWLNTLANASNSELVGLAVANPEGSNIGDAAFSLLAFRLGTLRAAHAAVDAERSARELEIWLARMEQAARNALAA